MSVRLVVPCSLLVLTLGWAAETARATINALTGYSASAIDGPAATASDAAGDDFFVRVAPALTLQHEGSRTIARLSLGFAGAHYFAGQQPDALGAQGVLAVDWDAGPGLRVVATLGGDYQRTSLAAPTSIADVVPAGTTEIVLLSSSVGASMDLSRRWRGVDTLKLALGLPQGGATQTRTFTVGDAVAAQVSQERDAFQLQLAGAVNFYDPTNGGESTRDVTMALDATWERELGWFSDLSVSGGAAVVVGQDDSVSFAPIGGARLSWRKERRSASVAVAERVQGNPLVGQTFIMSELTGGLGYDFDKIGVNAIAGLGRGTTIGGGGAGPIIVARASLGASWAFSTSLGLTFGFEVTRQTSSADAGDERLLRSSVMLGLQGAIQTDQFRMSPGLLELRVRESEEREREEQHRP